MRKAIPTHITSSAGRKGKRASSWGREPHVKSAENSNRMKQWELEKK